LTAASQQGTFPVQVAKEMGKRWEQVKDRTRFEQMAAKDKIRYEQVNNIFE
jgi:hypothetical protein